MWRAITTAVLAAALPCAALGKTFSTGLTGLGGTPSALLLLLARHEFSISCVLHLTLHLTLFRSRSDLARHA